ncbi:endonuclease domain-containing protein [Novosphingobium sp. M1R2S20]|uniref:Endonuclease domain-containing protein n=1 Tax=Novosphingobium rhizovicinum TaxID=3228928 RepID=A0ABV3R9V4_9SPHN
MTERKTLGISQASTPKADPKASFAATGARLDKLKVRAREARRAPTLAQQALWEQLSGSRLGGVRFLRQSIVGSVIVDFACPSRWIAVVLSPEGANPEVDALQDKKLTDVGVRVLRFAESDVLDDADAVVRAILTEVNKPFDKRAARRSAGAPQFAHADEGAEG